LAQLVVSRTMEAKDEGWQDSEAKETKASRVDAQATDAKAADESRRSDSQEEALSKASAQVRALVPIELISKPVHVHLLTCLLPVLL